MLQVVALGYLAVRYVWAAGWFGPRGDRGWLPHAPWRSIAAMGVVGALLLVATLLSDRSDVTAYGREPVTNT